MAEGVIFPVGSTRIRYVEPNYVTNAGNTFGVHGEHTNELIPPLEDYCIFVNLAVEVRGRNINISQDMNSKRFILNWESVQEKGNADFFQGTKFDKEVSYDGISRCSLTTRYTDTYIEDVEDGNNTELFGISSIDIEYNNMMVPQVNISFVDVRGGSLFSSEEKAHNMVQDGVAGYNNPDIAGSFFKSFFTFPYPRFTLAVKGFYGQPVTYDLTCADWRATFDSKTGNFNVNAKFVGFQFSFLGDVMLNALTAAPCSDYLGAEYWKNKVQNGTFTVMDTKGNMVGMPTIAELLVKYNGAIKQAQSQMAAGETAERANQLDSETKELGNVIAAYSNFTNTLNSIFKEKEYTGIRIKCLTSSNGYISSIVYITEGKNANQNLEDVFDKEAIDELYNAYEVLSGSCDDYNASNNYTSLSLTIDNPSKWKSVPLYKIDNSGKALFTYKPEQDENNIIGWAKSNVTMANKAFAESKEENKRNCMDNPNCLLNGFVFVDNGFTERFSQLKERNARNVEENTKKQAEEEIRHLSDALGFTPSVENMTRIMMAHFETFVYMIRQTAINIENQGLDRQLENLGINKENIIDLPRNARVVPPFPKVTEIASDASGNETQEETWIGDFDGDWYEEDLVNGIINGVKEVADSSKIYEAESTGSSEFTSETVRTQMQYPLSPLDILINGNPYGNSLDFNDISDVVGKVVVRAYQLLSLSSFKRSDIENNIDNIAKIEAYNFSKLFSEVPNTFVIKVTNENNSLGNIANEIIYDAEGRNASMYGKNLGNGKYKYAWVNPKSQISYPLVKKGMFNDYALFNGFVASENDLNDKKEQSDMRLTYVPVYSYSFESISNNFSKFNVTDKGYPLYEKPKSITNIVTNAEICKDDNYSMMDNNAVFFDNSPKRYKNMLENNFNNDEQSFVKEIEKAKKLFECFDYTKSNYKNLFKNTEKIFCPIENEVVVTDEMESPQVFPNKVRSEDKAENNNLFNRGLCDVSNGYDNIKYFSDNDIKDIPNSNFWEDLDTENCRLHFFYAVDEDGDVDDEVSLFGSPLYYTVERNELKAIMFLLSLKYYIDYKECFKKIFDETDKQCVFVPQAAILLAGAILWVCSNQKEFEKNEHFTNMLKSQINDICVKEASTFWKITMPLTNLFKTKIHMFNLRNEVRNVYVNAFLNWANGEFRTDIAANLEIPFKDKKSFFNGTEDALDDYEWYKLLVTNIFTTVKEIFRNNRNPELFFLKNCNHSKLETFYANYLTVDKDVSNSGILLAHRDSGVGVIKGTKVCLKMYAVVKGHRFQHVNERKENSYSIPNILIKSNNLKKYLTTFFETLGEIYNSNKEENTNISKIDRANATTTSSKDIKIAIYRYCKLLYDKWIAGDTMNGKYTMEYFFGEREGDKHGAFIFIDAFYKRIGQKMIVNIGDFMQRIVACQSQQQSTLLSFFSAVYAYNKFNFFCINNFLDLSDEENLVDMFRPIPYLDMKMPQNNPNFIVMFPYEPSSHLEDNDVNAEYPGDSFIIDKNGDHLPKPLLYGSTDDYNVPAFGVSYGKMYQSYFTDVDVGMENPITTDQSIKAQFQIASMNNTNEGASDKKMVTLGQDLFTVYSNNSYTCTVKMMGCAWVQPLMYFCLTNVPLFRGTYQIMNVTHQISPGNMVTTFKGVRMANSMSRRVKEWNVIGQADGNGENASSEAEYEQRVYASANIDNDCDYKIFPLTENNGKSFADDLSKKVTPDMVTVYQNKLYTDRIIGLTVKNALARMVDVESGPSGNELQKALVATTFYNRRCRTGFKEEIFNPQQMSCLKKNEMGNEPTSDSLKIVEEIFTNGPLRFVGQITDVHKPVVEERQGIIFKKGEKTHSTVIDEIVLRKMYFFINPYTEMYLFKNSWIGPILCQHHAFGEKYEHAFCAMKDWKDCWVSTKIHNDNGDNDENKFIKIFAKAVHDTCESSSSRCNIGFDPTKIKNNTFRFTCDDKSKLSVVFDVCLNTSYFGHVKKLLWIVPDNGSGKEYPAFIRVQVTQKNEQDKIVGMYYNNGSHVNVSDCNEDYIKCISKYLSSGGNKAYIKTMPSKELLDKHKPQNCGELINSSDGRHNYGNGGILNGGMIGNWNAGKSAQHAMKYAFSSSRHVCAKYTMDAIRAGGVVEPRAGHADWLYYDHILENQGWQIVSEGATVADFDKTANPQLGDICISTVYLRKSIQAKQKPPGEGGGYHACLFCGKQWVSDYKQSHAIPYMKTCKHWWLFRYSGKGMKLLK